MIFDKNIFNLYYYFSRQRREAINVCFCIKFLIYNFFIKCKSGYNELKDLLPASASFTGCKYILKYLLKFFLNF